ncbi:MAG: LuxR C-terminal-related transcriptional regulator [Solirubrobacteraceae bacterium]
MLIAHGATIREATTQLFLSPKTIEAHLGRVYRKLRIHNDHGIDGRCQRARANALR